MPRPSKHEQARVLYQYYLKGHSVDAIAKAYGASVQAVYYLFKTYDMPCDNVNRDGDDVKIRVSATQYRKNLTEDEIRNKILSLRKQAAK